MGGRGAVALLAVLALGLSLAAPAAGLDAWVDSRWHFRVQAEVNASTAKRVDFPVEVQVNFTNLLQNVPGVNQTFDPDSARVVEYNAAGQPLVYNSSLAEPDRYFHPAQFDRCDLLDPPLQCSAYNNTTNANGTVVWILNGTTQVNVTRRFYIYFDVVDNAFPPGTSPKSPPSFGTAAYFNVTNESGASNVSNGNEFWLNTTNLFLKVDTERGSNTSGIYEAVRRGDPGSGLFSITSTTAKTGEYTRTYNGTTQFGYDLRNNTSLFINGPVKKVVQQQGEEFSWDNASNKTGRMNLTKRYTIYNDSDWVIITQVFEARALATLNNTGPFPGITGCSDAKPCPDAVRLDPNANWLVPETGDQWPSIGWVKITGSSSSTIPNSRVGLVTGADGVNRCHAIFAINLNYTYQDLANRGFVASFNEAPGAIGVGNFNETLVAGDKAFHRTAFSFRSVNDANLDFDCNQATEAIPKFDQFTQNFTNPLNVTLSPLDRWEVRLESRTEFGGADVTVFNRGESLNATGRLLNDTHLLNDSDGPQNATINNSTSTQELELAKVNDTNWSRSYTVAANAVTGPWNVSVRINDSAGRLLNRSNRTFEVTDIYWVNVTNLTNNGSNPANASGFVILVNGSSAIFNLSIHNFRWAPHVNQPGAYGIAGLTWQDVDCTFEQVDSPVNKSNATLAGEIGGGDYNLTFTANNTNLTAWNLSCFVSGAGPNTLGNYGNNTTLRYLTEPRGSFLDTNATNVDTGMDSLNMSGVTGNKSNSTNITITLDNTGLGHVFDVRMSITNLPSGWTVNSSTPLLSAAYMNNTTANRTNTRNLLITVPANATPGNYSLYVNTTWKNLEEKTWGNQTWDGGRTNNSSDILYINVTATPILELNTSRIVLGNLSHNTTVAFPSAFLLNSTGNDWLNNTLFTLNQSNFTSGITVTFSKNNTNIPPNNTNITGNNTVDVTVTVAKHTSAGNYEGRFYVNATGSYGRCAAAPGGNCNATLNISLNISESAAWNTTDYVFNNSADPDRHLNANTITVTTGDTNFALGFLNVTSEANLNLAFSFNKTEQAGRTFVNFSSLTGFNFSNSTFANFTLNTTDSPDFKNITLNYTIPGDFAGSSWVKIIVNASRTDCEACPANHTANNSKVVTFDFTLQAADLTRPSIFNVSVNGDSNTTNITGLVLDAGRDAITIAANVTDVGTGVRDVWANISLPNGSWDNSTQLLQVSGTSLYRNTFSVPALNGTYALFIVAFDNNTTANCAVNSSDSATAACSPWPLGARTFNATNNTSGSLEESPILFEADSVVFPGGQTLILNTTFVNLGPGGAYGVWLNISISLNNTTAIAINGTFQKNESCGNVARGAACTRFFSVTALPQAFNGTYAVNTTLRWTNPNGSVNASLVNSTLIRVWTNPVLNLSNGTGASVEDRVVNVTVNHNTTNYSVPLQVLSNGNSPLLNVTWNMTGVNASGSSIAFAFNVSGFTTYPGTDLLPGTGRDVLLNVTVPEKHPNGTWEFRFESNASNSVCVSAARCGKTFNLSVFVPVSPTWTLNDSTGANVTCGTASNRVEVNKASTELCAVRVNNTANVDLNFTLAPASQFVNATESSGNLSLNNSSFIIGRLGAASFFNVTVNTTNVAPGQYNLTLTVEARDNATNTSAQPLLRNLTVNITVFTKPIVALVNATTPNETVPRETNYTDAQGRPILTVLQGEGTVIYVNVTDKSGSANAGIQRVEANVSRPDGTNFLNVSTDCRVNCGALSANSNSTWRIQIPGANFTMRGNYTANITAVDNLGNPSDINNLSIRVKPRLFFNLTLSKTAGGAEELTYGDNDRVYLDVRVTDLIGNPVGGTNVTVNFTDPGNFVDGSGFGVSPCTAGTAQGGQRVYIADASGRVQGGDVCYKLSGAISGNWTVGVMGNNTSVVNNTTSLNWTTKNFTVSVAELSVTARSLADSWKPGDLMVFEVTLKDRNNFPTCDATARLRVKYPNISIYNDISQNSSQCSGGLFQFNVPLGLNEPLGTWRFQAEANKTGSTTAIPDTEHLFTVSDTLTADLSLANTQFNNTTMNVTILVFRSGNQLTDPTYLSVNFTTAAGAAAFGASSVFTEPNAANLSAAAPWSWSDGTYTLEKLNTGYFILRRQIAASQATGNYLVNLTARRGTVETGDLAAFEITLSSLDVNVEVLSTDVTDLSFRATITNPGDTGPVDVTVTWSVAASPPFAAGTQACQIRPHTTTTCPTIKVVPPGAGTYNIAITVAGPGVQTVNVLRQVNVGGAPPPPPPGGPGAAAGGGAAGGGAAPSALERPALKVVAPRELDAVRGYRLNYTFTVENGGELRIPDLNILLQGVPRSWWSVASEDGTLEIGRGQVKGFTLTFQIPPDAERGRLALTLVAEGQGARDAASLLLTVYGDWSELIPETMRRMNDTHTELARRTRELGASGANVSGALDLLNQAGGLLNQAREAYVNRDFTAASLAIERARTLLDRANTYLAAVPRVEPVPVAPQMLILGIVGVLASAAFGVAVWTGQIARSLSRTTRSLVLGPEARPAPAGPPPPPGPPPSGGQAAPPGPAAQPPRPPEPKPPPADPFAERMNRARESTEKLVKSLQEQMEKGLISKERYEDLVRKIRR